MPLSNRLATWTNEWRSGWWFDMGIEARDCISVQRPQLPSGMKCQKTPKESIQTLQHGPAETTDQES